MHGHSEWSTFYKSIHSSLLHLQSSMLPLLSSCFSNITHTSIVQSIYLFLLSLFMCVIKLVDFTTSRPAHIPRPKSQARSKLRLKKKSVIAFRNSVHNNMTHCHRGSAFIIKKFDRIIVKSTLQQKQQKRSKCTFTRNAIVKHHVFQIASINQSNLVEKSPINLEMSLP